MPRPHVTLNAAMTLDGKIATFARDSKISSKADLVRLHRLRAGVDAVMVGAGTILADNPSLTVRLVKGKNPVRVVVDGRARIPADANVLDGSAKTIVASLKTANRRSVGKLRRAGADVILFDGGQVDLRLLLAKLSQMGVRRLLLEGGSTLNWNMIAKGLVDEIQVTVAPRIVGGEKAKTLVGGKGFANVKDGAGLKLIKVSKLSGDVLLVYRLAGAKRD